MNLYFPSRSPSHRSRLLPASVAAALLTIALQGCADSDDASIDRTSTGELSEVSYALATSHTFEAPTGDTDLAGPVDLAATSDRVWVLDAFTHRVHVYGRDGEYRRSFGSEGRGPGELSQPTALGVAGDTLWVYSSGNTRIDFFDLSGDPIGTQHLPRNLPGVYHLREHDGTFVGTLLFGRAPLVRFPRQFGDDRSVAAETFGDELYALSEETSPSEGRIADLYRLSLVGGRVWATHLYLPVVGLYTVSGEPVTHFTYPSPPVRPGETSGNPDDPDGASRKITAPENPAGGLTVLRGGENLFYVASHQTDADGRQKLFAVDESGGLQGVVTNPMSGTIAIGQSVGLRSYVLAAMSDLDVPEIRALEPESSP